MQLRKTGSGATARAAGVALVRRAEGRAGPGPRRDRFSREEGGGRGGGAAPPRPALARLVPIGIGSDRVRPGHGSRAGRQAAGRELGRCGSVSPGPGAGGKLRGAAERRSVRLPGSPPSLGTPGGVLLRREMRPEIRTGEALSLPPSAAGSGV